MLLSAAITLQISVGYALGYGNHDGYTLLLSSTCIWWIMLATERIPPKSPLLAWLNAQLFMTVTLSLACR